MARTSDDIQREGARTQSLFREVNERIERLAGEGAPDAEAIHFLCECANRDCVAPILLTIHEYEEIRRIPTHFPVLVGHDDPEIERVVEENDRYAVVEKYGDGGGVAVKLDPRRRISADQTDPPS